MPAAVSDYSTFVAGKLQRSPSTGLTGALPNIHESLFPFQRDLVRAAREGGNQLGLFSRSVEAVAR